MSGQHPPNDETEIAAIPKGLRILAMFLRALVFGALVAMIVHVSSPQSEAIWTIYDTPRDLIMLALGFAVCLGIVIRFSDFPRRQRHTGLGLISDLCSLRSQWSLPSGSGYGLRQLRGAVRRML
jgi:hypothetical protein